MFRLNLVTVLLTTPADRGDYFLFLASTGYAKNRPSITPSDTRDPS